MTFAVLASPRTPPPVSPPSPPSTGKEMPKSPAVLPSVEQARREVLEALAIAGKSPTACARIINPKTRLAFDLARPTPAAMQENHDAWIAFARCAEHERYYRLMEDVSYRLLLSDKKNGHPELVARAMLGLDRPLGAATVLGAAVKENPHDANVLVTWAKCSAASTGGRSARKPRPAR